MCMLPPPPPHPRTQAADPSGKGHWQYKRHVSPTWTQVVPHNKGLGRRPVWVASERGLIPAEIQRYILFWRCHGTAKHLP